MIQFEGVSVQRGAVAVLTDVTLTVGKQVVALVGPSGSGKTTLLRVLLGLEASATGRVSIGGRVVNHGGQRDVLPEDRNVAMVFQDLALWPHLSVYGNLEFGLKARGISRADRSQRIAQALGWVGLESKMLRGPHELSGGERQRVAIARALVLDPVALLLDEPLGSLDIALKEELLELFKTLVVGRGLPVLYVTHDPREAARLAQRIVVLEGGRIAQAGTLAELAFAPATPFVRAFIRAAGEADA